MTLSLITPPASEPIDMTLARLQCRSITEDDALVAHYIKSSREQCEALTERAMLTQTWMRVLDDFPERNAAIELGMPPIQAITSVQYVPSGGSALVTLDPGQYTLDAFNQPGWVLPTSTWPATADVANAVRVTFTCGWTSASAVPAPLITWMLLNLGALYDNRAAIDQTGRAAMLPDRYWDAHLNGYRRNFTV